MESSIAKFTRVKIRLFESGLCKVLQSYSVQSATIIGTSLHGDKQMATNRGTLLPAVN